MIVEKFHDCKKTFFDCRKDNRADNFEKIKIRKLIKIKKNKNKNKDKKKKKLSLLILSVLTRFYSLMVKTRDYRHMGILRMQVQNQ